MYIYIKIGRNYQEHGTCMQQHCIEHFSEEGHHSFLEDVSITLIDKTAHQTLYRERTIGEVF